MNAPAETVSALPAAARARLERLQAEASDNSNTAPSTPPAPPAPPASGNEGEATNNGAAAALPAGDSVASERVTISREDYNALKASAAKADRAELELLELDELRHRLTQLEAQGKGGSEAAPPASPASPAAPSGPERVTIEGGKQEITPEEQEQFGESQAYVEKIAANKVLDVLGPVLEKINAQLSGIAEQTHGLGHQFQQTQERTFQAELKKNVPNLSEIIGHKHWGDFLDEVEDLTGATYEALLGNAVAKRNMRALVNIYKAFQTKYMGTQAPTSAEGYTGAAPSGGEAPSSLPGEGTNKKLKLSARKQASEDFRKGRITWEKLQEVDKAFKEAEAKGLVDNNS